MQLLGAALDSLQSFGLKGQLYRGARQSRILLTADSNEGYILNTKVS